MEFDSWSFCASSSTVSPEPYVRLRIEQNAFMHVYLTTEVFLWISILFRGWDKKVGLGPCIYVRKCFLFHFFLIWLICTDSVICNECLYFYPILNRVYLLDEQNMSGKKRNLNAHIKTEHTFQILQLQFQTVLPYPFNILLVLKSRCGCWILSFKPDQNTSNFTTVV